MQRLSCLETNYNALSPTQKINNNINTMLNNNKPIDHRYSSTTITTNSDTLETDSNINQYSSLSQQFKTITNEIYQQNFIPKFNNDATINSLQFNGNQTITPLSKEAIVANIKRHSSNNQTNNSVIKNCYEYQQPQQISNKNLPENIVFDQVYFFYNL